MKLIFAHLVKNLTTLFCEPKVKFVHMYVPLDHVLCKANRIYILTDCEVSAYLHVDSYFASRLTCGGQTIFADL